MSTSTLGNARKPKKTQKVADKQNAMKDAMPDASSAAQTKKMGKGKASKKTGGSKK
jgi:hypothetical protein